MERNEYPEKNYRACHGVLNFAKRVGHIRLQNARKRANSFGKYSFGIIERIVQSKMDRLLMEGDLFANTATGRPIVMPKHDNIRRRININDDQKFRTHVWKQYCINH